MDARGAECWRGSWRAWKAAEHVGGRKSEGAVAECMCDAFELALLAMYLAGINSGEAEKLGKMEA